MPHADPAARLAYQRAYYRAHRDERLEKEAVRRAARRAATPPKQRKMALRIRPPEPRQRPDLEPMWALRGPTKITFPGPAAPHWKGDDALPSTKRVRARRLYSLEGVACEDCGAKATDRHHIDGDTGNNVRANIALLCRRCHMVRDGRLAALAAIPRPPKNIVRACETCGRPTNSHRYAKGECHRCRMYTFRTGRKWAPKVKTCSVCGTTENLKPQQRLCLTHYRERQAAHQRRYVAAKRGHEHHEALHRGVIA